MKIKYKVGDAVRFLNETGGGTIIRIDERGMIFVETDDGFEIPALTNDLIPADGFTGNLVEAESYESVKVEEKPVIQDHDISQENEQQTKLPRNITEDTDYQLLLGFVPESEGPVFSQNIECYLVNDSSFCLYYLIGAFEQGRFYHLASGRAEDNMKYYIKTFNQTDLSKISGIHLQAMWISDGMYSRKTPVDVLIDLTQVNFSKERFYHDNDYFDDKTLLFSALSPKAHVKIHGAEHEHEHEVPVQEVKPSEKRKTTGKRKQINDTYEVDLHIDRIIDNSSKLSPSEIINLQIKRLHESMEEAISKKVRRVVIIHGVGQGTLKMQIRKELQDRYPEFLFQDASFKEYGFGATLVHLHTIRKQ